MTDHTSQVMAILAAGCIASLAIILVIKIVQCLRETSYHIGEIRRLKKLNQAQPIRHKPLKHVVTVRFDGRYIQVKRDHLAKLRMDERDITSL